MLFNMLHGPDHFRGKAGAGQGDHNGAGAKVFVFFRIQHEIPAGYRIADAAVLQGKGRGGGFGQHVARAAAQHHKPLGGIGGEKGG